MLLGEVGGGMEAGNLSTIGIRMAQWGQWTPVMGGVVEWMFESGLG